MPVTHVVMFHLEVSAEAVAEVHAALVAARNDGGIEFDAVALGTGLSRTVSDGGYGGAIQTGGFGARRLLVVTLADCAALDRYYEAPAHSVIRKRFLSQISSEIAELYSKADAEPRNSAMIYEAIETRAADFMCRFDFEA